MKNLDSYLSGSWQAGSGNPIFLLNPTTAIQLASVKQASKLEDAVNFARNTGGPNLRALTFQERGQRLEKMAKAIHNHREELIEIAIQNGGNTRGDAKFDIDGATAVLAAYAEIATTLGDKYWIADADSTPIYHGSKIRVQHVEVPRQGVAIHINAFNFPAWGMIGKAAVAFVAGMPILSKPATSSSMLAHRIAEILLAEEDIFPEGSFQLLMGPVGDLLDHLGPQDVVAFTGSANTGAKIRAHSNLVRHGVRVNIEADSLNAAVIGPDLESGSELLNLVVRDLTTEMTQKAGQKCTATRRIIVPESCIELVRDALVESIQDISPKIGNPSQKDVRVGPLANETQLKDARSGVEILSKSAKIVLGDAKRSSFVGVEPGQGYFFDPHLLEASKEDALNPEATFHHTEVFGPVATLLPYDGTAEQAARILGLAHGSLVSTVYTDDRRFMQSMLLGSAAHLGRLVFAEEKIARASMSPGCVFPWGNHGGPGRAGGGAELGGRYGLSLYMQRTAIQGGASQLARLLTST